MENNIGKREIVHEITPKFSFVYELFMPTGKKIKSTLILLVAFVIGYVVLLFNKNIIDKNQIFLSSKLDMFFILNIIFIAGILFGVIKLFVHVFFQSMQYKSIKYTFYKDHMIYEDSFLNQHKKNILYSNIKEVEIRRSIWDRLLGFGIIVIYTNAENEYSNGLVIFGIKNAKQHYDIIDNLVHNYEDSKEEQKHQELNKEDGSNPDVENIQSSSEGFKESLKHIQK